MSRTLIIIMAVLLIAILGLGGYVLTLRRSAEQNSQPAENHVIAPPVSGSSQQVALYLADDEHGKIEKREVQLALADQPNERATRILHELFREYLEKNSPHPLAAGSDVKSVYLLPGNMAVVDTTPAFANGHRSGVLVETLSVASLAETLAANMPGVARVKILVDGKERDTLAGHADLTCFYDVSEISELMKDLQ
jgi:hypothetical protein